MRNFQELRRINRIFCNVNYPERFVEFIRTKCINRIFCNVNIDKFRHKIDELNVLIEYFVM